MFRCRTCDRFEDGRAELRGNANGPGFFNPLPWYTAMSIPPQQRIPNKRLSALKLWYWSLDSSYTARFLTKQKDRLPAIAGVARALSKDVEGNYAAGLWMSDLPWGLLWLSRRYQLFKDGPENFGMTRTPQTTSRAPSWSWASVDGGTRYVFPRRFSKGVEEVATFHTVPQGKDFLGELEHRRLEIEAPFREAEIIRRKDPRHEAFLKWSRKQKITVEAQIGQVFLVPVSSTESRERQQVVEVTMGVEGEEYKTPAPAARALFDVVEDEDTNIGWVYCLSLTNRAGLLLCKNEGEATFRRIGQFSVMVQMLDSWYDDNCVARRVDIV